MKSIKILLASLLFSSVALASGPASIDFTVDVTGYGIEASEEEAAEVARRFAFSRMELQAEEVIQEFIDDGYVLATPEESACSYRTVLKSSMECSYEEEKDMVRCDYRARIECNEAMWYPGQ